MFAWLKDRFELSRGGSANNLRSMEGLRGFAVLLVFVAHYVRLVEPWIAQRPGVLALADVLHAIGSTGVDLFFVLSGYLIYGSLLAHRRPFLPFMARRIERLYPTFTAVFVIYVLLSLLFPVENKIPNSVVAGALYLLANYLLLPGLFPIQPMITVAWSLSYEMFYYLCVPLAIALLELRRRSPRWRTIFFLCVALAFASYTATYGGPKRLLMFISGMLLLEAISYSRAHTRWHVSSSVGLSALIAGLASTLVPIPGDAAATVKICILFVAFFLLCLACLGSSQSARQNWLSTAFTWTPLRWLGNMSYSYYLLHGLALKAAFMVLSKALPPTGNDAALFWALLPPTFVLTLIPSAALFLLIERPFSLTPRRPRGVPKLAQAASASESGS